MEAVQLMDGNEWNYNPALFLHQGIALCQKVVNFTNNPANGCKNTLPVDYCTYMDAADYGNSMNSAVGQMMECWSA